MDRQRVASERAPAAIGPYSQAIRHGSWVFLSGQIGLDPSSGELVEGGTAPQAKRALDNLVTVLAAAGMTFDNVLQTTIYLTDLEDFAVNEIYGRYVKEPFPARATVGVASLPKGASVEIAAIAAD